MRTGVIGRWTRHRRLRAAIGGLSALALVAGACGDDTSTSSSGAVSDSAAQDDLEGFLVPPDQLPEVPAITGEIPADLSIHLISTGNETDQLIEDAMNEATDLLGWNLEVVTTNRRDPVQANAAVQSALQSGADAIVTPSVDAASIEDGLAEAESAEVPVIQIGSYQPESFAGVVNSLAADGPNPDVYGQMLAAAVVADAERAGTTANVGILTAGTLTWLTPIFDAFSEHLAAYCPDCTSELIDAPMSELATGQAANSVVSALQRNPDLNYVMLLGPFSAGVRPGLDSNGFEAVKIVGFLPTTAQLQEMVARPEGFVGWVVVPNAYDGFASVDAVVRAVSGDDPAAHNDEQEPLWIVAPDSELDASTLPELPVDYAEVFSQVWGVQ